MPVFLIASYFTWGVPPEGLSPDGFAPHAWKSL